MRRFVVDQVTEEKKQRRLKEGDAAMDVSTDLKKASTSSQVQLGSPMHCHVPLCNGCH